MRIALMVGRLFFKAFYYFFHIWWCGISKKISFEESYRWVQRAAIDANRAGRVTIEAHGVENVPKEGGFVVYAVSAVFFFVYLLKYFFQRYVIVCGEYADVFQG